uniref:Uncharacterized protein n=1 Tax=Plectus sambesii TaxID=2011161 RepID=A0A914VTC2_9BILA
MTKCTAPSTTDVRRPDAGHLCSPAMTGSVCCLPWSGAPSLLQPLTADSTGPCVLFIGREGWRHTDVWSVHASSDNQPWGAQICSSRYRPGPALDLPPSQQPAVIGRQIAAISLTAASGRQTASNVVVGPGSGDIAFE